MDENQQPSVQQELERGGGRGGESRELRRVGAGESSASTTTDTNTSFATPSTTKPQKYGDQTLVETSSKFAILFHVKTKRFQICYVVHVNSQVWSSTTFV